MRVSDKLRLNGVIRVACPLCGEAWRISMDDTKASEAMTGIASGLADMDSHICRSFTLIDGGRAKEEGG